MKQECKLIMVWLTWLGIPILAIILGFLKGWWVTGLILTVGLFSQIAYVKYFPKLSKLLGYGSVHDIKVEKNIKTKTPSLITLYTANVCPFCPIVKKRLVALQKEMEFKLTVIDISFKAHIMKKKGFTSVPVIEMDGKNWVGNATSSELYSFITKQNNNKELNV